MSEDEKPVIEPDDVDGLVNELGQNKHPPEIACNVWGLLRDLYISFEQIGAEMLDIKSRLDYLESIE